MKRALISVTDKSNIDFLARELKNLDYEIISTGGTLDTILKSGVEAVSIEDVTGFPQMLDGRVKTLHPMVHGALLYKRDNEAHVDTINKYNIKPIDIVVVNLYDFEGTFNSGKAHEEII